jgi:tetratricopeptide (TPR) repeat protein
MSSGIRARPLRDNALEGARRARRAGQSAKAIEQARTALAEGGDAERLSALSLLGEMALAAGQAEDAVALLRQAIGLPGAGPEQLLTLGQALLAAKRLDEAERAFTLTLKQAPQEHAAERGLGFTKLAQANAIEAIAAFHRALEIAPHDLQAHAGMAQAFSLLGLRAAAHWHQARAKSTAKALPPESAEVCRERALALAQAKLGEAAETMLERALAIDPDYAAAHAALGSLQAERGASASALDHLRRALALAPDEPDYHVELGRGLALAGTLGEAETHFRQTLARWPSLIGAKKILANALLEAGRPEEALSLYDQAIVQAPDQAELHNNRANALLLLERFEAGWDAYEWRRRLENGAPPKSGLPDWQGEPLKGRRLHLIGEQAAGDAIMFASCLPELAKLDGPIHLHCERRIATLFARSFPWLRSVDDRLPEPTDGAVALPLGSLPRLLRHSPADFPRDGSYLRADPARVSEWRDRYAVLGPGLKLGFSWRGGKAAVQRRQRTIALTDFLPLFRLPGIIPIDLQYGDHSAERTALGLEHGIRPFRPAEFDPVGDMDGFAAQVAGLDLVISIDNTTVHFAGGLGLPCWTLAPRAPSWRWGLDRPQALWYPAMRLIHQGMDESWAALLTRTAGLLAEALQDGTICPARQTLPGRTGLDSANFAACLVKSEPDRSVSEASIAQ